MQFLMVTSFLYSLIILHNAIGTLRRDDDYSLTAAQSQRQEELQPDESEGGWPDEMEDEAETAAKVVLLVWVLVTISWMAFVHYHVHTHLSGVLLLIQVLTSLAGLAKLFCFPEETEPAFALHTHFIVKFGSVAEVYFSIIFLLYCLSRLLA